MAEGGRGFDHCKRVTALQFNVFEDGLTLAPGSIGFPSTFEERLDKLLLELCDGGTFLGISKTRDFTSLPSVVPIDSTSSLFGFLDVVYTALYHGMGGNVEYQLNGTGVNIGNSARTLFLSSTSFETELVKANVPEKAAHALRGVKDRVFDEGMGVLQWDAATVECFWKRGKNVLRDKWENKSEGPFVFIDHRVATTQDPAALEAMSRCCQRVRTCEKTRALRSLMEVELEEDASVPRIRAVRTVTLRSGLLLLLQQLFEHSAHLPSAAVALHSFVLSRDKETGLTDVLPISHFAALGTEERARIVFKELDRFVGEWAQRSSLEGSRHAAVSSSILSQRPAVCTVVEFDKKWRSLPALGGGYLASAADVVGHRGDASILYDWDRFELLADEHLVEFGLTRQTCPGFVRPTAVRNAELRAVGEGLTATPCTASASTAREKTEVDTPTKTVIFEAGRITSGADLIAPKSSCVALLRLRGSEAACERHSKEAASYSSSSRQVGTSECSCRLLLAVAVHLASAPPSDSANVAVRRAQLETLLDEINSICTALQSAGLRAGILLGGDFNGIREEFLHGNGRDFFSEPVVRDRVRPPWRYPEPGTEVTTASFGTPPRCRICTTTGPVLDRIASYSRMELLCESADDGVLTEASTPDRNADFDNIGCTRAGKAGVVIDFLFVGSTGYGKGAGKRVADTAAPIDVATAAQINAAADEKTGIYSSILEFGSDHLPVACSFLLGPN